MVSPQLPLASLLDLCRVLRHHLGAGLSLVDVFRQQAQRGSSPIRPVAQRILASLQAGESLTAALAKERSAFPPLFLALIEVGETTGRLPEMCGQLETYYRFQQTLRRQFWAQSLWPLAQLVFAVLLIAGLIWLLGVIAGARGNPPLRVFGLAGFSGATTFLLAVFGSVAGFAVLLHWTRNRLQSSAWLLRWPVLGPCLESLMLARFSLALQATLDSSLPIQAAVRLSCQASGQLELEQEANAIGKVLKQGRTLTEALATSRLLPQEFLEIVAVAEEAGRVPEALAHQAERYQEEATRRLALLLRPAAGLVWMLYAVFMIFLIFSLASIYLGALGG